MNHRREPLPLWAIAGWILITAIVGVANIVRAIFFRPRKTILWMMKPIKVAKQFLW